MNAETVSVCLQAEYHCRGGEQLGCPICCHGSRGAAAVACLLAAVSQRVLRCPPQSQGLPETGLCLCCSAPLWVPLWRPWGSDKAVHLKWAPLWGPYGIHSCQVCISESPQMFVWAKGIPTVLIMSPDVQDYVKQVTLFPRFHQLFFRLGQALLSVQPCNTL